MLYPWDDVSTQIELEFLTGARARPKRNTLQPHHRADDRAESRSTCIAGGRPTG